MPPGFRLVQLGAHRVLCQDTNEAWVRQAITAAKPASQPATLPADLLARLAEQRTRIIDQLAADLAMEDPKPVATWFDEQLVAGVRRADEIQPKVYFLVTTKPKLKALLLGGWENPAFHYNRTADDIFKNQVDLVQDDLVVAALSEETSSVESRAADLTKGLEKAAAGIRQEISGQSQFLVQRMFIDFLFAQAFDPLKLSADQQWLGLGITGVLSAKYAAMACGTHQEDLLARMTFEDPRQRIKMASIDLLHPMDLRDMRPEYVPPLRRRHAAQVHAGRESLAGRRRRHRHPQDPGRAASEPMQGWRGTRETRATDHRCGPEQRTDVQVG